MKQIGYVLTHLWDGAVSVFSTSISQNRKMGNSNGKRCMVHLMVTVLTNFSTISNRILQINQTLLAHLRNSLREFKMDWSRANSIWVKYLKIAQFNLLFEMLKITTTRCFSNREIKAHCDSKIDLSFAFSWPVVLRVRKILKTFISLVFFVR